MVPFFIYTGIILALPFLVSSPQTTVILLDNNLTTNGVVVTTQGGSTALKQSYTQTTLRGSNVKPEPAASVDEEAVRKKYAQMLDMLPLAPVSLLFYFEEGSVQLTPESMAQTASLAELIQERKPCIVDIIGHTDTKGSAEANYELALKRALMVKSFLDERQVELKKVSVTSYGEGDPLVATGDGVAEPRNRRVEVTVR